MSHLPSLSSDAVQKGRRAVLTMRAAAAELYALPWELLATKASGQHLGELPLVLLRYAWPEIQATPESPMPRPEGGRILVAWPAAVGAVPASEHIAAIGQAAQAGFACLRFPQRPSKHRARRTAPRRRRSDLC